MERITNSIARKLASELDLDNDKQEVIAYGVFSLLQIIISILLVIVFGLIFNVAVEALIVSFTSAMLRKYSGGVHASSPSVCNLIGTVVCVGQAIVIAFLLALWLNVNSVIVFGVIIFIWSFYLINKLAPVDNEKKPIKKEEKRKKMRKRSIVILFIYVFIVVFFIWLYMNNGWRPMLIYSLCIYGGVLWQVFTLTKLGHSIVRKVDIFLSNILHI